MSGDHEHSREVPTEWTVAPDVDLYAARPKALRTIVRLEILTSDHGIEETIYQVHRFAGYTVEVHAHVLEMGDVHLPIWTILVRKPPPIPRGRAPRTLNEWIAVSERSTDRDGMITQICVHPDGRMAAYTPGCPAHAALIAAGYVPLLTILPVYYHTHRWVIDYAMRYTPGWRRADSVDEENGGRSPRVTPFEGSPRA